MQSSSQIVTTNKATLNFLQARCPSCCTTNIVKVLKGKWLIIYRVVQKKSTQTLMRYNLSTAGHRVTRFPAKCSETNW